MWRCSRPLRHGWGAGAGPMTEAGQDLETRIRERAYAL